MTLRLLPERLLGSGSNHSASTSATASLACFSVMPCRSHTCLAPYRQSIECTTTELLHGAGSGTALHEICGKLRDGLYGSHAQTRQLPIGRPHWRDTPAEA